MPPRLCETLARAVAPYLPPASRRCCSRAVHRHTETDTATSSITASNVTLTAAQQQNIHLSTVELSKFHKTVDTTGTVDFDNDQATTILAPMSGPVSRLLVSLGDQVKAGQPLAEVDSPDFATAISTYRKALATAKITRQLADQDQELLEHHGVSLREAEQAKIDATNAEADAEAALQQLVSLKVDAETIKAIKDGKGDSRGPGPDSLARSPARSWTGPSLPENFCKRARRRVSPSPISPGSGSWRTCSDRTSVRSTSAIRPKY